MKYIIAIREYLCSKLFPKTSNQVNSLKSIEKICGT